MGPAASSSILPLDHSARASSCCCAVVQSQVIDPRDKETKAVARILGGAALAALLSDQE